MAGVSDERAAHVGVQPGEPAWWQQYRKAIIVAGIGLLAFLTDLATSYASGDSINGGEWLHAMIVLVSTLLSTGGVAAFGNVYSRGQLEAKLAALPSAVRS